MASQRVESKPAFQTLKGEPIFPTGDGGEDALWWLTDISRDKPHLLQAAPHELDSAGEDEEVDTDSDNHATDNIDENGSSDGENVAVGDLNLSQQCAASAIANHEPGVCWRTRQDGGQPGGGAGGGPGARPVA